MEADKSQEELRVTVFDKRKNNGRGVVVHEQKRKHETVGVCRSGSALASRFFFFVLLVIIFVCKRLRAGILSVRDTGPFQGAALGGVEELVVVVVGGCMALMK